jgi:hypothetical protein
MGHLQKPGVKEDKVRKGAERFNQLVLQKALTLTPFIALFNLLLVLTFFF